MKKSGELLPETVAGLLLKRMAETITPTEQKLLERWTSVKAGRYHFIAGCLNIPELKTLYESEFFDQDTLDKLLEELHKKLHV